MVDYWAAEGMTSYKAYMNITRDEDETLRFLRRHAPARKLGHAAQPA